MERVTLLALNARFYHSNLAVRYLKSYLEKETGVVATLVEGNINQPIRRILEKVLATNPTLLGISCYLWNYEEVCRIAKAVKRLSPDTLILLGGPEVSYRPRSVFSETGCDLICVGEGELPLARLVTALQKGEDYRQIPGLCTPKCPEAQPSPTVPMAEIPFPYTDAELSKKPPIVYFETSRGCPFSCRYCLSGRSEQVRFLPMEQVYAALDRFLGAEVPLVKFVDRTFNCNKTHTLSILRYIKENANDVTRFHFEIAAELLDEETIALLRSMPRGQVQLEIGVQSTNPPTLEAIHRITLPEKLTPIVAALREKGNLFLHLDLIAGLPYEDMAAFRASFNYVYSLCPDELQLGFLKLLPGSGLWHEAEKYGLICEDKPPYQVLATPWLSFNELNLLHLVEEMHDVYGNTGRFTTAIREFVSLFPTPFDGFRALAEAYPTENPEDGGMGDLRYWSFLQRVAATRPGFDPERFRWLCLYDICCHQKPRKKPDFIGETLNPAYRDALRRFSADPKNRDCHVEVFPFHPLTGEKGVTPILFTYDGREPRVIPL